MFQCHLACSLRFTENCGVTCNNLGLSFETNGNLWPNEFSMKIKLKQQIWTNRTHQSAAFFCWAQITDVSADLSHISPLGKISLQVRDGERASKVNVCVWVCVLSVRNISICFEILFPLAIFTLLQHLLPLFCFFFHFWSEHVCDCRDERKTGNISSRVCDVKLFKIFTYGICLQV